MSVEVHLLRSPCLQSLFVKIMDLHTKGAESEDVDNAHPSKCSDIKRRCTDCQTTRTPCWRGGPAGPRTLCNACGIRQRKRRRTLLGLDNGGPELSRKKMAKSSNSSKLGVSLKLDLMGFIRDGTFQEDWKRKLGEEEQAAVLLMALSCGSVCAWYKKDEGKHFYPE